MAARFLCCLPLRFGVLLIAFLQFIVSGVSAGIVWWTFYYIQKEHLAEFSSKMKAGLVIFAVVYTIVALVSFFGFLGALVKKYHFVSLFAHFSVWALGFQIGVTIFEVVAFLQDRQSYVDRCIGDAQDQAVIDACRSFTRIPTSAVIILALIPILVQAYGCYIIAAYRNRLGQEKMKKSAGIVMDTTSHTAYKPVQPSEESRPLTHPYTPYPYADASHSFGQQKSYQDGSNHV